MKALAAPLALFLAVAAAGPARAQDLSHGHSSEPTEEVVGYVPGADRLEGRIRAPCCWNQTLDIHHSDVSSALKREIRQRLRSGESADAIEASIVARYGEKVLAVPDKSPLKGFAIGLSAAMGVAGIAAAFMLVRWRRRSNQAQQTSKAAPSAPAERDELDERLDREIENQA
jgi:cytochrome c-type biogenesis protein CcmH